jgi:maltose O-acetyltransferase
MTTERERMLRGDPYNTRDEALLATAHRARALLGQLAHTPSTDSAKRGQILASLLGGIEKGVWIETPFFCDYGENVYIGALTFVNVNCVFLDSAEIRIGANGLIGPGVQLITVEHPLRAEDRIVPSEDRAPNQAPFRTYARPIRIGDNVWIGAGAIVMPGVTIGDDVTIGAASLVTRDVPSGSLAFGQPARVQRTL